MFRGKEKEKPSKYFISALHVSQSLTAVADRMYMENQ